MDKTMAHLQGMLETLGAEEQHSLSPPPLPPAHFHSLPPPHAHHLTPRSSLDPSRDPSKRDYYVKNLRFPPDIVEDTLDSLGPKATDNDIMHRLNQLMTGMNISARHAVEEAPALPGGHVTSHVTSHVTAPVEQRKAVVIVDPKKLRPIVIDGSNVAMR